MRFAQAGKTDAFTACRNLDGGETEPVAVYRCLQFVHLGIRLGAVAAEGEEFHHARVGIDAEEKIAVAVFPVAQDQAFGAHGLHWENSSMEYPWM